MTRPEVVHRDMNAEIIQLGEDAPRLCHVLHRDALGDLELQKGWSEA